MTRDSIEKLVKHKLEGPTLKSSLTHGFQGDKGCGCGVCQVLSFALLTFVRWQVQQEFEVQMTSYVNRKSRRGSQEDKPGGAGGVRAHRTRGSVRVIGKHSAIDSGTV